MKPHEIVDDIREEYSNNNRLHRKLNKLNRNM